ncbi:MRCKA kinase, partial [Polypterus senegalus]|nr:MRCKA kinase [Polypterus senegalus]
MDYYAGGDLLTLLSKFEDRLPEDMARFYIAEMVLAIHSTHQRNYVHRDIKPDNVLIDMNGHIRLADFGSCLKLGSNGTIESPVAVGTPDYISPEILQAMEDGKGKYGTECDWWSLGVCTYELLFGETPFYAESLVETYGKIMNHQDHLQFPADITDVSDVAKDLIRHLICEKKQRLGKNGIDDFKKHPFFNGIDWDNILTRTPPYIPEVTSPFDTSNFDVDDDSLKNSETPPPTSHGNFAGHHLPFVGFTYTSHCALSDRGCLKEFASQSEPAAASSNALELKVKKLERENGELSKKLQESQLESNEATKQKREDESKQIKTLENQLRSTKQEKDSVNKELVETQEKLKVLAKELNEAQTKLKQAVKELQDMEEKQTEARSQRQKLSRQLRDKEEEMEVVMAKVESLRQELRKVEKSKKELENMAEESGAEATKQRKLRERSESYGKQLEEELDIIKKRPGLSSSQLGVPSDTLQELSRLRTELERLQAEKDEELSQHVLLHTTELKTVKNELRDSESQLTALQSEVNMLKEKLDKARNQSLQEHEEMLTELQHKQEREKNVLKDAMKKLSEDVEKLSEENDKLQGKNKLLEEEIQSLNEKKEAIANWEAQITDILQWVNDEKDSRSYLQALTTRLSEEMENLRAVDRSSAKQDNQWKARRLQKMEASARLELQSALDAELRAKQGLQEELNKLKATSLTCECKLQEAEKQNSELKAEVERLKNELKSQAFEGTGPRQSIITLMPLSPIENNSIAFSGFPEVIPEAQKEEEVEKEVADINDGSSKSLIQKVTAKPNSVKAPTSSSVTKPPPHQFKIKTFTSVTKCQRCTSLMLGLVRQGVQCEVCSYACHLTCSAAATICPTPPHQMTSSLGVDPVRGKGTAYEGYLSVPKPAGVKKGWQRALAVVSDFKLFLFDIAEGRTSQTGSPVSQVIDLRDPQFSVSSVFASDVIHANKKDIPCILRVTYSQLTLPKTQHSLLLLADNESEKGRWEKVLNELHLLLKKHKLPDTSVFLPKEAFDSALPLIRTAQSAAIVDQQRIALGTEEGLYLIHVTKNEILQMGDCKKVTQINILPESQLLVVLSGRSHSVRLYSWEDLQNPESCGTKIQEARNVQAMTTGTLVRGTVPCLCFGVKRQVYCYSLNIGKVRYKKLREVQAPGNVQWLGLFEDRLCIGYPGGFTLYPLTSESGTGGGSTTNLVNTDDPTFSFLTQPLADALCAVEMSSGEFLLCFNLAGVYVDSQGCRSRKRELIWLAPPITCCYTAPFLSVFTENAVDIFDVNRVEWIQTISLKKVRSLNTDGSLSLFGTETVRLIYLRSKQAEKDHFDVPETEENSRRQMLRTKSKRRFSFRISDEERLQQRRNMLRDPSIRSKLISNPTNFSHLVHVGPGEKMQNLRDLPNQDSTLAPMNRPRSATESGRPLSAGSDQALREMYAKRQSRGSFTDDILLTPQCLFAEGDMLSEISGHTQHLRASRSSSERADSPVLK